MSNTARPTDRKISSSASLFKKVLQAFANGDLPYSDVQSHLERLLNTDASPEELREVLNRYESIEPLPAYAHEEILRLLNEAIARAAAPNVDSDPARSQRQDAEAAPASISGSLEPIAAAVEARMLPSAVVSAAVAAAQRPLTARATALNAEATASAAENVSSIEDRIARQKADYKALNHAYERVRDAGSAASARTIALAAELAAMRAALESEQEKARAADKTLTDSIAFGEAARARGDEARRELEHIQLELRSVRDLLAARDAVIGQLRLSLGDRDDQIAALQADHTARIAALDSRASVGTRSEAELQAERARSTALRAELANARAALESEHSKSRETRKALAERVAAEEAAQSQGEDALRKLEGYRAELSKARDLLAARQQEHRRVVAVLEERTNVLEAQLQAAETRVDAAEEESRASQEITVAIDPARERGPARPADPQVGALQWEPAPAATTVRIDAWETAPTAAPPSATPPGAAPESKRTAQFSEFPLFGSRGRGPAAVVARFAWVGAALAVLAVVTWIFIHHAPESQNVSAVVPAAAPQSGSVIRDCPACPALTIVPAGRFKQGSNRTDGNSAAFEKPPHWVLIGHPFAISTNPVTVDEFRPFIAATGRDMRGCDTYDDRWRIRPDANWENPGFVQTGSHPVTCVSWDDAKAYAGWLSKTTGQRYRLPSAAEWEYAARAGGEAVRPWTDGSGACASANVADQRAARRYPGWTVFPCDDGYVYTAPVGSFKANSFGLNDMLGNVFQWTDDCWHADYTGVPTDGSSRTYGDCSERELRGGSWFTTPEFVRASYRNHFGVNYRASSVGIRLVRDIAP